MVHPGPTVTPAQVARRITVVTVAVRLKYMQGKHGADRLLLRRFSLSRHTCRKQGPPQTHRKTAA